jgi:hypothetical protein
MSDLVLSHVTRKVLRMLRRTAMDGYTLQSEAKLSAQDLVTAVMDLLPRGYLSIEGEPTVDEIGRAYLHIPLQARGLVDEALRTPEPVSDKH